MSELKQGELWRDKTSHLVAQLERVDGDVVWYTIPQFSGECQVSLDTWLRVMEPA